MWSGCFRTRTEVLPSALRCIIESLKNFLSNLSHRWPSADGSTVLWESSSLPSFGIMMRSASFHLLKKCFTLINRLIMTMRVVTASLVNRFNIWMDISSHPGAFLCLFGSALGLLPVNRIPGASSSRMSPTWRSISSSWSSSGGWFDQHSHFRVSANASALSCLLLTKHCSLWNSGTSCISLV